MENQHFQRPTSQESEEEIIEQERVFQMSQKPEEAASATASEDTPVSSDDEFPHFDLMMKQMGPIVERTVNYEDFVFDDKGNYQANFPTPPDSEEFHEAASRLIQEDFNEDFSSSGRKKSVFARLIQPINDSPVEMTIEVPKPSVLAAMTDEEIIETRDDLLKNMDPGLIDFLQRTAKGREQTEKTLVLTQPGKKHPAKVPEAANQQPSSTGILEKDKLQWAQDMKPFGDPMNGIGKEARFNFEGTLIVGEVKNSISLGLHHHGEEMERPGYTIAELCQLGRSTFNEQRIFSFKLLRKIFIKGHEGQFDEAFDNNLFQALLNIDFLFFLRKGIDFSDSATVNEALGCLAAMFYPDHEENSLDVAFLWKGGKPHPSLAVLNQSEDRDRDHDVTSMKDFLIPELDVIYFFIKRTDILTRINFILHQEGLLNDLGISSVIQILIRFARHSPDEITKNVMLVEYIMVKFIQPATRFFDNDKDSNKKIYPEAWKLIRVLICSHADNANMIKSYFDKKDLTFFLGVYSSSRDKIPRFNDYMTISKECLKIFNESLHFKEHIGDYLDATSLFTIVLDILCRSESQLKNHQLDLVTHIIQTLERIIFKMEFRDIKYHLSLAIIMVQRILVALKGNAHSFDSDLAILTLASCLDYIYPAVAALTLKHNGEEFNDGHSLELLAKTFKTFLKSKFYEDLANNLSTRSILLMSSKIFTRYPDSFKTTMISAGSGILPLLRPGSPFNFFRALCRFSNLAQFNSLREFILVPSVKRYLTQLFEEMDNFDVDNVIQTYFLRFELTSILKICALPGSEAKGELLVRLLPLVTVGKEDFALEILKLLQGILQVMPNVVSNIFSNRELKVLDLYGRHMLYNAQVALNFDGWSEKLMTNLWYLDPVNNYLKLFKGNAVKPRIEIINQDLIDCLAFSYQLIECLPSILKTATQFEDLYVRVISIFLYEEPETFLHDTVQDLLKMILKVLVRFGKNYDGPLFLDPFADETSSINVIKFSDKYKELLRAFESCSYGDHVFTGYLLIPTRTPEDRRLKLLFWNFFPDSSIRLPNSNGFIDIEYLMEPREKDKVMKKCYQNIIVTYLGAKRCSPFLKQFLFRNTLLPSGYND